MEEHDVLTTGCPAALCAMPSTAGNAPPKPSITLFPKFWQKEFNEPRLFHCFDVSRELPSRPQMVSLIAGSIVLFVVGYVIFQRQEVRAEIVSWRA